jgi:hypothetical protein
MAKIKKANPLKNPANFMGRGVNSPTSGTTPYPHGGMGDYYGTGMKNPIGKMRSDSIGYRPVSRKQLGAAPKSIV